MIFWWCTKKLNSNPALDSKPGQFSKFFFFAYFMLKLNEIIRDNAIFNFNNLSFIINISFLQLFVDILPFVSAYFCGSGPRMPKCCGFIGWIGSRSWASCFKRYWYWLFLFLFKLKIKIYFLDLYVQGVQGINIIKMMLISSIYILEFILKRGNDILLFLLLNHFQHSLFSGPGRDLRYSWRLGEQDRKI